MPTDPSSTKRFKQIIIQLKQAITRLSSDANSSIGMVFKGATIKTLPIKRVKVPTKELSLTHEETVKINDLKPMYVLTKNFTIPDINTEVDLNSQVTNQIDASIKELKESNDEKEKRILSFKNLSIPSSLKKIAIKPMQPPKIKETNVIFKSKLHSIEKLTTEEPETKALYADRFKKPAIKTEDTTLRTYTRKRSPSFPTNLPIEKKPTSLLLFSERDLSVFKRKLADKHKVNIQLIKITSVYNNLNINNIQNLKYDSRSGNIYYTFKPKTSSDNIYAFMVFGLRRDNNTSISTMVNTNDLKQT